MGRRGPPPTPTPILKLRGSRLAARRSGEPQADTDPPPRPTWLSPKARYAWETLVPMLRTMRVLAKSDGRALARYCELWAQWRDCEDTIREKGATFDVHDEAGNLVNVKARPEVNIQLRLSVLLLRLEQEFGLTPAARARLDAAPPVPEVKDPKAALKARLMGHGPA